jgi:hypothetical protein
MILVMVGEGALKVRTVRFGDDDVANVGALALGDETFSQTVRRVLREAAQRNERKRAGSSKRSK